MLKFSRRALKQSLPYLSAVTADSRVSREHGGLSSVESGKRASSSVDGLFEEILRRLYTTAAQQMKSCGCVVRVERKVCAGHVWKGLRKS